MEFFRPATWADALAIKAERPGARAIAGGTGVMVEINFDRSRPEALLDLTGVADLAEWSADGRMVRLGAGVPYTRVIAELGDRLPGLTMASRTAGSPQIRNRGTVGGNLGSASPAGDAHPPLLADGCVVEAASVRGTRDIPIREFFTGVKRSALAPDELIAAELADRGLWDSRGPLAESAVRRFGELVAEAAAPIDDVRGTAAYRRHSLAVMARRTLAWAWQSYREERQRCA
jgi:CO/xanthine dehydrogenase FAD-binding subunit